MFRTLNEKDERRFRIWAQENYANLKRELLPVYHPIVHEEVARIDMLMERGEW